MKENWEQYKKKKGNNKVNKLKLKKKQLVTKIHFNFFLSLAFILVKYYSILVLKIILT